MLLHSYRFQPPVLEYFSNLVVYFCAGSDAVWHVAALEFVTMLLVRSFWL